MSAVAAQAATSPLTSLCWRPSSWPQIDGGDRSCVGPETAVPATARCRPHYLAGCKGSRGLAANIALRGSASVSHTNAYISLLVVAAMLSVVLAGGLILELNRAAPLNILLPITF